MRVRSCCGELGTLSDALRGGGNGGDDDTYLQIERIKITLRSILTI